FETIEPGGRAPKDLRALAGAYGAKCFEKCVLHLVVARGQEADRPVGAEHQTAGTESLERDLYEWAQVARFPAHPSSLGHHTRELAEDVRESFGGLEVIDPALRLSFLDSGLGQMVDHHGQFGKTLGECCRVTEMLDVEEEVEGYAVSLENAQTPRDV